MSGQRKLCLSCMCAVPSDAKSCPKCGYNGSQKNPEQCLPIGYRLCSKYVVGMHKSFDGDSCTYIGFDCTANTVVEIKEFLPHSGCSRDKQDGYSLRPTQDAELHYKTALMDFVELYRNLAKLSNEQTVIKVQDFFEANLTAYAVLETFNGVTLREFLDMMGGTIPFDKCMILLSPVLDALSRIHSVNLIHRGVSPETIFVNRNGDVKLGGYATSSVRTKDTEVAPKLFSGYSAPEQYSSTMWQSACTDVYGIAAVFYRCLTGVGPQDAEQRKSYDTLERPIALQSTIPQIVSRTIMMGMLVNTKERIQSTQDFKKMLNNEALPVTSKTKIVPTPKIPNESRTVKKTQLTTSKQSNNRIEKNKSPKPERTFPWVTFIVVSIAVIAVVGVMAYVGKQLLETLNPVTPDIDASQSGIEVPNYVGINMAELKYDRDNFKYVFEKTTVANTPDKQIVSQDPTAGSSVQSGTSITLYYNESQKTEMIKVTGYTLDKAKEMLDEAGIKYKVVEEGTKDYAVGTIFKQGVNEGVGINVATQTVTITVATEYHGLTSTAPPPAA